MAKEIQGLTPPMGWNSWNTFGEAIHEDLIRETADIMAEEGFRDAGYDYLVIDDCWSLKERGPSGELREDPAKFPSGIKALADYVHGKGLKFGMYSCCGVKTCAGYPGSFGREFQDARQFAGWGVDFLKYDNCFKPQTLSSEYLFRRMGLALKNCGRDIIFSACQWGTEDVHQWIRASGAELFRSTYDIRNEWASIKEIALSQIDKQAFSGNYCHNDLDMLVVGMYDKGHNKAVTTGKGCSVREYQTHFALWAMLNSPLMIGCDLRTLDEASRKILLNEELIAVNQDPCCRSAYRLDNHHLKNNSFILVKMLSSGDLALGFFNLEDEPCVITLDFWDLGLPQNAGFCFQLRDLYTHETLGRKKDGMAVKLEPHASAVYRLTADRGEHA